MRSPNLPFKISIVLILFILLFSLQSVFAQSGWQWQNPIPQGKTLNDCQSVSSSLTFAVGNSGAIIKSTNGGANWQILECPVNFNLNRVQFLNSNTGYVIGDALKILKTTDSGISWNIITVSGDFPYKLKGLSFINENTGVVVGWGHFIQKTTNGGLNWINLNSSFGGANWEDVYCLDENNIVIINGDNSSSGNVYKSVNGGTSWQNRSPSFSTYNNTDITFVNATTGFVAGANLMKTTDAGLTWAPSTYGGSKLSFLNPSIGFCVTTGSILKTIDGGSNWVSMPSANIDQITGVSIATSNLAIAVGQNGIISSTSNLFNWNKISTSFTSRNLNKIAKVNDSTAVIVGNTGGIFRTSNSGGNWSNISLGIVENIVSLNFINSETGFAGSGFYISGPPAFLSSSILKTTNSGLTWTSIYGSNSGMLGGMYFADENTGYYGTTLYTVKIFKTTNGGTNWSSGTDISSFDYLDGIYFINANTGFIWSPNSSKRTSNGGSSWDAVNLPCYTNKIQFLNANTGFMAGNGGYVMYSSDGGINWENRSPVSAFSYNTLYFFNTSTGYVVDDAGIVRYTSNAGLNWSTLSFSTQGCSDICFLNSNRGFIIGSNGSILTTGNGGFPSAVVNNNIMVSDFSLSQNYPNPFNPTTKINFDLKNSAFAMLRVYDITGREVRTLVNQKLSAGSYSYDFNASELPSGVYFYQLQTDGFIETKKMILLK